jgi:hypothetical protein
MKESDGEGPATHTGPESCVGVREGEGEALTCGGADRVFSRESPLLRSADAVRRSGRRYPTRRRRETRRSSARSETPGMPGHTSRENRESPWSPSVDDINPVPSHRLGTPWTNAPPMSRRCCQSAPERSNESLDAGGGSSPPGGPRQPQGRRLLLAPGGPATPLQGREGERWLLGSRRGHGGRDHRLSASLRVSAPLR